MRSIIVAATKLEYKIERGRLLFNVICGGGCDGAGLWFLESRTAKVCGRCKGTGREFVSLTPFVKRKNKRGVEKVIDSHNGITSTIMYKSFKDGKFPGRK